MNRKIKTLFVLSILITMAAACGPRVEPTPTVDPEELMAQIAMTIEAEITQNAMLTPSATATLPPTATPPPQPTQPLQPAATQAIAAQPLPANSPDNAIFVQDVTIPDNTVLLRNASFTKTWKIENTGTTTWDTSYSLIYIDGPVMSEQLIISISKPVRPNEQLEISIPMKAPNTLGTATTYWQMMNDKGQRFGDVLYVQIVVGTTTDVTATPAG